MFASVAATVASFIGYTPYVFNETLAAPYWHNGWGNIVLYNEADVAAHPLTAGFWKIEHFLDQSIHWVISNAILLVWLLWATRSLYRRFKVARADDMEAFFVPPIIVLFAGLAARIVTCWALNLYYEGWLIHSAQVLYVEKVERKAYHCSYLALLPIVLMTVMPWAFESEEERAARAKKRR